MSRGRDRGFALLDVLVAALVASIALASLLGGIALAGRASRGMEERLRALVQEENEDAQTRKALFAPAQPAR